MLKMWCIALVMICFPKLIFSQANEASTPIEKTDYKAYIGFNLGFSIPNGSFEATNIESNQPGYATNGQSLQLIDLGYRFYQNLNASFHYLRLQNGFNENAFADNLRTQDFRYGVEASNYELNAAMVGLGFVKPTNSISLQMQIMLGFGNVFIPSILIEETNQSGDVRTIQIASAKENGFGFGVSGGFRIHLNERLDLSTQASFINFQKDYEQVESSNGQVAVQNSRVNYEVIAVNFGLAYRFMP